MAVFGFAMNNNITSSSSQHETHRSAGSNDSSPSNFKLLMQDTPSSLGLIAEQRNGSLNNNGNGAATVTVDTVLSAVTKPNVFTVSEPSIAVEDEGFITSLPAAACLIQELQDMPLFGEEREHNNKRRRFSKQEESNFNLDDDNSSRSSTSNSSLSSAGMTPVPSNSINQVNKNQMILTAPKPLERQVSQGDEKLEQKPTNSNSRSSNASVSSEEGSKKTTSVSGAQGEDSRFRNYQEGQWNERFNELINFSKLKGHTNVPHNYPRNKPLARWVKRQRYQYRLLKEGQASTMTEKRIQALEKLGFVWDCFGDTWKEKLEDLKAYKEAHGNCDVPCNYGLNPQLATWVKCQRRQYKLFMDGKASSITMDRIRTLEAMSFRWGLRSSKKRKAQQQQQQQDMQAVAASPSASLFNAAAFSQSATSFSNPPSVRQALQFQQQLQLQQAQQQQQQLLFAQHHQSSSRQQNSSRIAATDDLLFGADSSMLDFRAV